MAFPSTFADIQNAVLAKARLDASNTSDVSKVKDWINQVYSRVCLETECLQESDTMTLTANIGSYTLPTAVARIKQMVIRPTNQGGYNTPLVMVDLATILRWRQANAGQATTNGTAMYYCVSGFEDLDLYPTPGNTDTLLLYYVKYPTALSSGTDVPAIPEPYASKLLEIGALMEATDYLKDTIGSYTYPQMFEDWLRRFRQHLVRRQGQQTKQFGKAFDQWRPPTDPSVDIRSY